MRDEWDVYSNSLSYREARPAVHLPEFEVVEGVTLRDQNVRLACRYLRVRIA